MPLRARLLLCDAIGLLLEGASIAVPAYLLYGLRYGGRSRAQETLLLGEHLGLPVLATLLLFSLIYALWQERRLRPLRRAPSDAAHRERVYTLAATLPRHSLYVRTLLWSGCGLLSVAWLARPLGAAVWPLFWLFSLNPLLVGAVHSLLYDRVLWGLPWRSLPEGVDPLRRLHAGYRDELTRATLVGCALAILCTLSFTYPMPFALEGYQWTQRYLPALLLGMLFLAHGYSRVACAPLDRYLHPATQGHSPERAVAISALRGAQSLPYRLGGAFVIGGVAVAALLLPLLMPRLTLEQVLLQAGVALCAILVSALSAVLWYRAALRPLCAHLQQRYAPHPDEAPAPLSLRARMAGGFGLLVGCACGLTLLWSVIHFTNLSAQRIQSMAEGRAAALVAALQAQPPGPLPERLRRLCPDDPASFVYFLPAESASALPLCAPPGLPPPELPLGTTALLRRRDQGHLQLHQVHLTGVSQWLPGGAGVLLVLYPDPRHPAMDRGALGRGALLLFSAVLLFASGGMVVVSTADLAGPLRYLQRRTAAMARGELAQPITAAAVDTDEIRHLSAVFEQMRRALSDKLRTSAQLNLHLEEQVQRRTEELSRRNQEVSEALRRLSQVRDELGRVERLATMGRIAASVTTEINNPVNVMAAMPEPMGEALAELTRHLDGSAGRDERARELLAELRTMADALLRSAQRVKEVVQATRVHLRGAEDPPERLPLAPVVDGVLQLFGDLRHDGVEVQRDYPDTPAPPVLAPRAALAQLLSGYLSRVTPRLRQRPERGGGRLRVRIGARDGAVELELRDNGPPLADAQLTEVEQGLAERLRAQVQVGSTTQETYLRLRWPCPSA